MLRTRVCQSFVKDLLKQLKIHPDTRPQLQESGSYLYRKVSPGSQPKEETPQGPKSRQFDINYWNRDTRRMLDQNFQDVPLQDLSPKAAQVYTAMPAHLPAASWLRQPDVIESYEEFLARNDLPPTPGVYMGYARSESNALASQDASRTRVIKEEGL
eukprot:c829_g1_i1.p2 GENE.c829_g1_i1~~c829_g1_i1.p2  ORF type:complete len:157 (+),score=31.71 c829_g1_i1:54-524(+)